MLHPAKKLLPIYVVPVVFLSLFAFFYQAAAASTIDCSKIPTTTGPESIAWKEECGTDDDEDKTETETETASTIDCSKIPTTTGPESIAWKEECGTDDDEDIAELQQKVTLLQQMLGLLLQLRTMLGR